MELARPKCVVLNVYYSPNDCLFYLIMLFRMLLLILTLGSRYSLESVFNLGGMSPVLAVRDAMTV